MRSNSTFVADPFGFRRIHQQPSAGGCDIVAEHGYAADPLAFPPCSRELVSCSLADDLPLKLRKGEQDMQREPTHRTAGVELLRDRHEAHATLLKQGQ